MGNRVTHFEIPSDDTGKSMKFFKNVFGWTFQQFGNEDYWLATTGEEGTPGINGAVMKKVAPGQPLTNSIMVDDMETTLAQVEKEGGKVVKQAFSIPTVGWLAFFSDPDGNIHGVWKEDPTAR